MQERMQEQPGTQQDFQTNPSSTAQKPKAKAGDYIDFEEVK